MRRILLSLPLLLLVPLLMAPHYSNWHAFSNGEVADAVEVNENFVLAAAALDDFETRVSALEAAMQVQTIANEVGALVSLAHGVTMITRTTCDELTVLMPAAGADSGQIKHFFYEFLPGCPENMPVTLLEFQDPGTLFSKLKFSSSGQAVTLMYVGNAWRITNLGALVVP